MFLNQIVDRCHLNLFSSKVALAYLLSRKVSIEDAKKYKIGFIGKIFNNIEEDCFDAKFFNSWLGVKGSAVTNRIVFPIYDEIGNVRGIETRGLDKTILKVIRPEYTKAIKDAVLTLPNSTLRYKKFYLEKSKQNACFFGLPHALPEIWKSEYVFLTEGIFDCLSALKLYPNCLSSLTANLNSHQINWLKRYATKIIFLFDTDAKGISSVEKLKDLYGKDFLMYSIGLRGDDVNEMEIKHGLGDIKKLIDYKLNMVF